MPGVCRTDHVSAANGDVCAMRADNAMAELDRKHRALIGAEIRKDCRLTPTAKQVGEALLFFFMGALGRAFPSYDTLAAEAGCSVRSAKRAIPLLVDAGYITKTRRWGKQATIRAGRWVPTCLSNLYCWVRSLSAKPAQKPRPDIKSPAPIALSEGLARVLERLGHAIADKAGLPSG
jgi:hypothetical protein